MLDCDGVIWSGEEQINQAFKAIEKLESLGKKVFFLSNNATKSAQDSAVKMKRLGYSNPKPDQIFGTAYITAQYMKKHHPFVKKAFVIGMSALKDELQKVGI